MISLPTRALFTERYYTLFTAPLNLPRLWIRSSIRLDLPQYCSLCTSLCTTLYTASLDFEAIGALWLS